MIVGLERQTWPLERWHHREHLATAVWYLLYLPRRQALDVIRRRIQRYSAAQGITQTLESGYHETVTLFLAEGIGAFLDALPEDSSFEFCLDRVLEAFGDVRAIVRAHYSASTLESWRARTRWVQPDFLPMSEWLRSCAEAGERLGRSTAPAA